MVERDTFCNWDLLSFQQRDRVNENLQNEENSSGRVAMLRLEFGRGQLARHGRRIPKEVVLRINILNVWTIAVVPIRLW